MTDLPWGPYTEGGFVEVSFLLADDFMRPVA